MKTRERVLAIAVAAVLVLVGGGKMVQQLYFKPLQGMRAEIVREQARSKRLDNVIAGQLTYHEHWMDQTRRTLDKKPDAAQREFRRDITELFLSHGLSDVTVAARDRSVERKGYRKGFTELPVSVSARGSLDQVVALLEDTYQRPYAMRLTRLKLNAGDSGRAIQPKKKRGGAKRNGRRKKAGGDPQYARASEPELMITAGLSTLVLPDLKVVPHITLASKSASQPASQSSEDGEVVLASAVKMLRRETIDDYGEISGVNFFKEYVPPPPPPPPVVKRDPPKVARKPDTPKHVKPPPARPDPRRDAGHFFVRGTSLLDGDPIVYVYDDRKRTEPPREYRLNDAVDDGHLVLVHASGMVVRAAAVRGAPGVLKNYFYPLGGSFTERVEVTSADHPELNRLLALVLKH